MGAGRWIHECRPSKTFTYRLRTLYHRFHAMLGVPLRAHFRLQRSQGRLPAGL